MNDLFSGGDGANQLTGTSSIDQLNPRMKQLLLLKYLQQMFGNQQAPQLAMPGQKQPAPVAQQQFDPMNLLRLQQLMSGGSNALLQGQQ